MFKFVHKRNFEIEFKTKMMSKIHVLIIAASALLVFSCNQPQNQKSEISENPIITQLKHVKGEGILFGHQDDLAYGVEWAYVDGESDVKRVTGDYPAMFGWELGGIEQGWDKSLDTVPFETIKNLAAKAYGMGGINTFSWHPYSVINDSSSWYTDSVVVKHILPGGSHHKEFLKDLQAVCDFFNDFKTVEGEVIPFIFRPWHEMDGTWFWWGSELCTPDEFKQLFIMTVDYMRNQGLDQMVVAYSPDRKFNNEEEYFTWYPGHEYADILGVDNYWDLGQPQGWKTAIEKLHIVINAAKKYNKLSAFTESGNYMAQDTVWYSQKYGAVFKDSLVQAEISFAHVWRNEKTAGYYFPYAGAAADDAAKFLEEPYMFLLKDFNKAKASNK